MKTHPFTTPKQKKTNIFIQDKFKKIPQYKLHQTGQDDVIKPPPAPRVTKCKLNFF